jgi:signal peptidase II
MRPLGPLPFGLSLAAIVIVIDQITKAVVLRGLELGAEPIVVTPFFNLVLVWNRGVSFGMFNSAGELAPWLLSGVALAVVVGLLIWLRRADHWWTVLGLGLVMGGALGNVIDRLRFGAVVDFLDFHAAGYHWPAFNVADAAICVGAVALLADGLLLPQRRPT